MPESFQYITIPANGVPPSVPLIVGRNWVYVSRIVMVDMGWQGVSLKRLPMRTLVVEVDEELK